MPPNDNADRAVINQRRTKAVAMRVHGATWQQVADECGYADRGSACTDIRRFREETRTESEEKLEELRALEVDRLDMLIRKASEILERQHLVIQGGKVVRLGGLDATGEPVDELGEAVVDDGPTLQAIDRIAKLSESRRKLLGIDAPIQVGGQFEVHYKINGVDAGDLT